MRIAKSVTCQQCGAVYHSEEAHIGKQLRCGRCGSLVPILDAARAMVQPPTASPPLRTPSRQPQPARPVRRFQPSYAVAAALGILLALGGVGLIVHLTNTDAPRTGTANVSDIDNSTTAQQQTADSQQGSRPELKIIGEEPIPKADKPMHLADPRPTHYNSPPTGTRCEEDAGTSGHGELTIENGTSEDAVVHLSENGIDLNQALRCFFVQAHSTARVARIPEGTYRLAGLDPNFETTG